MFDYIITADLENCDDVLNSYDTAVHVKKCNVPLRLYISSKVNEVNSHAYLKA